MPNKSLRAIRKALKGRLKSLTLPLLFLFTLSADCHLLKAVMGNRAMRALVRL